MPLGRVGTYAGVQAAVRTLYADLLSEETMLEMVKAPDYDALLTRLSETVYAPLLKLDRKLLTPRRTAYQIRRRLAQVYPKLIRLTPDPGRELVLGLWRLFDVANLKAALRGIEYGAGWEQVRYLLFPMEANTSVTPGILQAMVKTGSIPAALPLLKQTPYYQTLQHALSRYQKENSLFPLEAALDLDYRLDLWNTIESLPEPDRKSGLRLLGTVLDLDNLLWAIRYRVYHHLSAQEIVNYTIAQGYRLRKQHILTIAQGGDIAAVVAEAYPQLVLPEGLADPSGKALETLELTMQRYIVLLCRQTFLGQPFHLGLPLAYLLLCEHEINDLTAVIEAKAAHFPQNMLGRVLHTITPPQEEAWG